MPATAKASKIDKPAKPGRAGTIGRPVKPSPELAAIVGAKPLARTAVVSKVWDHIRAHSLQDPSDRRTIIADSHLRAVFGKDRATMFELNKLLSAHLTAV